MIITIISFYLNGALRIAFAIFESRDRAVPKLFMPCLVCSPVNLTSSVICEAAVRAVKHHVILLARLCMLLNT